MDAPIRDLADSVDQINHRFDKRLLRQSLDSNQSLGSGSPIIKTQQSDNEQEEDDVVNIQKSKVTFSNAPSSKPQQMSAIATPLVSERRRLRDTHADWAELIKMQTE